MFTLIVQIIYKYMWERLTLALLPSQTLWLPQSCEAEVVCNIQSYELWYTTVLIQTPFVLFFYFCYITLTLHFYFFHFNLLVFQPLFIWSHGLVCTVQDCISIHFCMSSCYILLSYTNLNLLCGKYWEIICLWYIYCLLLCSRMTSQA